MKTHNTHYEFQLGDVSYLLRVVDLVARGFDSGAGGAFAFFDGFSAAFSGATRTKHASEDELLP